MPNIYDGKENLAFAFNVGSKHFYASSDKFLITFAFAMVERNVSALPLQRVGRARGECHRLGVGSISETLSKTRRITKEDIFHYVYAVLHHPAYRAKYEINLKREFPRIPFYEDFRQWAAWGKRLMELHLGYEAVEAFQLERVETC